MTAVSEKTKYQIARQKGQRWCNKSRISFMIHPDTLRAIKRDAAEKKVSLSWLIRRLIVHYLETR